MKKDRIGGIDRFVPRGVQDTAEAAGAVRDRPRRQRAATATTPDAF